MSEEGKVTVVFDCWGQRCEAEFDTSSEREPFEWLFECYNKGFLNPVEIYDTDTGVILYDYDMIMLYLNG